MNQLEGPESGVELPRDPALPRDKPRLSWQLLSRTFGAFVFLDSFAMAWMPGHSPAFDTRKSCRDYTDNSSDPHR